MSCAVRQVIHLTRRQHSVEFIGLAAAVSLLQCSSTELDKWTPDELRAMVVGGNDAARAFFRDKGWTDMLSAKVRPSEKVGSVIR